MRWNAVSADEVISDPLASRGIEESTLLEMVRALAERELNSEDSIHLSGTALAQATRGVRSSTDRAPE